MVLHHVRGIEWAGIWFDVFHERETDKYFLLVQQYGANDDVIITEVDPDLTGINTYNGKGVKFNGAPYDRKTQD